MTLNWPSYVMSPGEFSKCETCFCEAHFVRMDIGAESAVSKVVWWLKSPNFVNMLDLPAHKG